MFQKITIVFLQVLTLFAMIGIGYLIGKMKKVKDSSIPDITFLMVKVALPCAIIKSFMIEGNAEFFQSISNAFLVILGITVIAALISQMLYRTLPREDRTVLQIGSIYGNSAFMGIALVQVVLGENAIIYATLIVIVETILLLLQCELTMSDERPPILKAFLTPGVIGFVLGLLRLILDVDLPDPVNNAIITMSGMNTPLAMIIVGLQMAKIDMKSIFTQTRLYACAFTKLILQPLCLMTLLLPFKLPGIVYSTIVICKGTTQAAVISAYAQEHGQNAVLASQLVALTSILQIVTLPVITAITQLITGG